MKFSLIILGSPGTHQSAFTAYRFAAAALKQGHDIYRIFFYHDGVYNSSSFCTPPQGEYNVHSLWQSLCEEHDFDMTVCIASALRRGILNTEEAGRFEKNCSNLNEDCFTLSGLGELIDATRNSDRVITFGC